MPSASRQKRLCTVNQWPTTLKPRSRAGEWLCWPCAAHEDALRAAGVDQKDIRPPRWELSSGPGGRRTLEGGSLAAECALCPVRCGAFRQTVDTQEWVHQVRHPSLPCRLRCQGRALLTAARHSPAAGLQMGGAMLGTLHMPGHRRLAEKIVHLVPERSPASHGAVAWSAWVGGIFRCWRPL